MANDRWLLVNPVVFQGRGFTLKPDHAFVIMPFTPKWSACVFQIIKRVMTESGIKCVRADEQYGHQILEDVWKGICEASVVVADVTNKNPNVYYELGIAHVLGRRVILITQDVADIPFDTRIYRHVLYRYSKEPHKNANHMSKLAKDLNRTVRWIQANEILPANGPVAAAYSALGELSSGIRLESG
jgi:nucleoside 2-deoxyribosyltransferase